MEEELENSEKEDLEFHSASGNLMETRTSHLDDLLNDKLEQAFHKQTAQVHVHDVAKIACEHTPIDLAYAVSRLPPYGRVIVYENLPDFESKIIFIINTDSTTRNYILRHLSEEEVSELTESMPIDEAVWVLEELSERRLRHILEVVGVDKAQDIRELMKHDRNSAGRLMTNEYFSFNMNVTIGEAAAYIRDHPGIDLTRRIFVLNQIGEVQGYVPARNLIINSGKLPLKQVMQPILHKVHIEATREEVVDIVERYKVPALPVVDDNGLLEGVITYEGVVEAMEDIADEAFARVAGTTEDLSAYDPTIKRFFARAPWLFVTLCAGLLNVSIISFFERSEDGWFLAVLFFIPLITGMSGNIGLQCSTILVRSMATGLLSSGGRSQAIMREITTGILTGTAFGIGTGVLVYSLGALGFHTIQGDAIAIAIVIGGGVLGTSLTSTLLGVSSPLFFAKMGVDPAVASGPIVTAFNDVLSTLIFFLIAKFISNFFVIYPVI
jgi:magnesium transporter